MYIIKKMSNLLKQKKIEFELILNFQIFKFSLLLIS